MRDDFSKRTRLRLAQRVGYRCSSPLCQRATVGAALSPESVLNIGVAAHITAASPNGPRFDPNLAAAERSAAENGIWLCQSCAKIIDSDPSGYPTSLLQCWKTTAEGLAFAAVTTGYARARLITEVCSAPLERLSPVFMGRDVLVDGLRSNFSAGLRAQVLTGAGGVGKTQVALAIAQGGLGAYEHILWFVADTEANLLGAWRRNAGMIGIAEADKLPIDDLEFQVFNWLRTHGNWLAILDNLDPVALQSAVRWAVLPPTGNTLITSRERARTGLIFGKSVHLAPLARDDSIEFLFMRTGKNADNPHEREAAYGLAQFAGDLPLELESVAADVIVSHVTLNEKLQGYRNAGASRLNTWSHQIDLVLSGDAATSTAVSALAFLASDGVPSALIDQVLRAINHYSLAAAALLPAINGSIVEVLASGEYAMHRLLQTAVLTGATQEHLANSAHAVVTALLQLHPSEPEQPIARSQCTELLPQVRALCEHDRILPATLECAKLFELAGRFASEAGLYNTADELLNRAQNRYDELGGQLADTALEVTARRAALKRKRGQFRESIQTYDDLLHRRISRYGPEHRLVALTYNNLGNTHYDAGDVVGAELAYLKAQAIWEALGQAKTPDSALTKNGLGNVLRMTRRLEEAANAFRGAIAAWSSSSEASARFYPFALNGLGNVLFDQGVIEDAIEHFELADRAWCAESGEEHHNRAYAIYNIGRCLAALGRWSEAEERFARSLALREITLGPSHPLTMKARNALERTRQRKDPEEWPA